MKRSSIDPFLQGVGRLERAARRRAEDGEREDPDEAHRERDKPAGHILEAAQRSPEEGIRAVGAL